MVTLTEPLYMGGLNSAFRFQQGNVRLRELSQDLGRHRALLAPYQSRSNVQV
jgi:hypothetical protein